MVPICHRLAFSIEVMGYVIAPFSPILGEVVTETATPTSSALSQSSGFVDVLLSERFVTCKTVSAIMTLNVMVDKILVEEVFSLTEIALEFFRTLLIRLLVTHPICLFGKRLLTDSTEILLDSLCAPSSRYTRYTSLVVVLFWAYSARRDAFP
jgi:hypothetical protein